MFIPLGQSFSTLALLTFGLDYFWGGVGGVGVSLCPVGCLAALTVFTNRRPVALLPQSRRLKMYPGTVQCPLRVKSALWESKRLLSPSWGDWIDHKDACASLENVLLFQCYSFPYSFNKLSRYQKCLLYFLATETVISWVCFKPDILAFSWPQ